MSPLSPSPSPPGAVPRGALVLRGGTVLDAATNHAGYQEILRRIAASVAASLRRRCAGTELTVEWALGTGILPVTEATEALRQLCADALAGEPERTCTVMGGAGPALTLAIRFMKPSSSTAARTED